MPFKIHQMKPILFVDGELLSSDEKTLEAFSPWNLNGQGVFETMRAIYGRVFALDLHLNRLEKGLEQLKIQSSFKKKYIETFLEGVLITSRLKDARLRIVVWKDLNGSHLSILATPYVPLDKIKYQQGFSATISKIRRDEKSVHSVIKSIEYQPLLKAYRLAQQKKMDEAIVLNSKGKLVEASRSNIFIYKSNILLTPALECGCLNGITRSLVFRLAKELKIRCKETILTPQDLKEAEEAFLTNSLVGILPLTVLEKKPIGGGYPGPVTHNISHAYFSLFKSFLTSKN